MTFFFFFFNDTATTEIYTLSLHDALPISAAQTQYTKATLDHCTGPSLGKATELSAEIGRPPSSSSNDKRSEEHTSELQSRLHLVCRLLLEKKKKNYITHIIMNSHNTHTST